MPRDGGCVAGTARSQRAERVGKDVSTRVLNVSPRFTHAEEAADVDFVLEHDQNRVLQACDTARRTQRPDGQAELREGSGGNDDACDSVQ